MFSVLLLLAIGFEVVGATLMPAATTNGWIFFILLGFWYAALVIYILLTFHSEVGITSALFTGGSTVLVAISGIMFYEEVLSLSKVIGIAAIIAGVIGIQTTFGKELKT
ncbi:multidrug efflux SMR transporter [Geomicrobium sp. JSM 1781026]|uniref:DMT family transporter n=1 Tax=Geomicrobium sp. JSM 1781026 TaxID=3344580 RepID=UPI0035BFF43F